MNWVCKSRFWDLCVRRRSLDSLSLDIHGYRHSGFFDIDIEQPLGIF